MNSVQNNGKAAGQVVCHVHFHGRPRFDGDALVKLGKSGEMIAPDVAADLLAAMKEC